MTVPEKYRLKYLYYGYGQQFRVYRVRKRVFIILDKEDSYLAPVWNDGICFNDFNALFIAISGVNNTIPQFLVIGENLYMILFYASGDERYGFGFWTLEEKVNLDVVKKELFWEMARANT